MGNRREGGGKRMANKPAIKQPVFARHYDLDSIEYRFKFWNTDEREIHRQIIHFLAKRLKTLRLTGDEKGI